MKFESIYLVTNLSGYDFNNVVLLADDVNAIVTELLRASGGDCLEHCEKLLFLGHLLERAIEASRRVVKNFVALEELLRVNWCDEAAAGRKWNLVQKAVAIADGDSSGGSVVDWVAKKVLLTQDGEKCLGIIKSFYKKFSGKEAFRKVIGDVQKAAEWQQSAWDYLNLKSSVDPEIKKRLNDVCLACGLSSTSDPKAIIEKCFHLSLPSLVNLANSDSVCNEVINKALAGLAVHIRTENEEFINRQLRAIRQMTKDRNLIDKYQDLMNSQSFYEVNVQLLKMHHQSLQRKELLYDSNTILMCYLIYGKTQQGQFLDDFLNEHVLGGTSNLELILAELQNFK